MTSEAPSEPATEHPADKLNEGMSRRGVFRAAGAGALALGLGGATGTAAQVASAATRKRPGSVSPGPGLPPGFTSRFIHANGLRQHVVIGGDGPPLLLVHGWPQFWYQFRLIMPDLARRFQVIAPDLASSLASLSGSFGFYRAWDTTTAQNQKRATRKLTTPVLAIGGAESGRTGPGDAMKLAADNVQTVVLPDCGHFVAEEAPQEMLAALTAFLIP